MKYGQHFMSFIAAFFGLSEGATETEVHQATVDNAGLTIAKIKADAVEAAKEAVAAQMTEFTDKVTALTANLEQAKTDHKTEMAGLQTQLEAAEKRATDADNATNAANEKVGQLEAANKLLSKEVADLKTITPSGNNETDKALTFVPDGKGGQMTVVSNAKLDEFFGVKQKTTAAN